MHEIVTLQFGGQANYLGTHFWNTQESYFTYGDGGNEEPIVDHDVSFREGKAADGSDTFTPRVLIYDVKEGFGTLRRVNAMYEMEGAEEGRGDSGVWGNTPIIRHNPPIPQHPYQIQLDSGLLPSHPIISNTVRFWSDYNHIFHHPRSLIQLHLPTSHIPTSTIAPLDKWETGEDLFKSEDAEHDLLDRDLRPFIEECDQLQGIQVLAGGDDAWAGFAAGYVERMRDEFGRKSIWVWGLEDGESRGVSREKRLLQTTNLAKSANLLAARASLYIAVANIPSSTAPSYLTLDPTSRWQTSALQVTALETATLGTRSRGEEKRTNMADMEVEFTNEVNRNTLQLSFSASRPEETGVTNGDTRMTNGFDSSSDEGEQREPKNLDVDLFRSSWGSTTSASRTASTHTFAHIDISRGLTHHSTTPLLFPRLASFPPIFSLGTDYPSDAGVAVQASLAASTRAAARMRFLADVVGRSVNIVDDREELRSELLTRAEEYVEGWEDEEGEGSDAE